MYAMAFKSSSESNASVLAELCGVASLELIFRLCLIRSRVIKENPIKTQVLTKIMLVIPVKVISADENVVFLMMKNFVVELMNSPWKHNRTASNAGRKTVKKLMSQGTIALNILSRVGVYIDGLFGLGDWIYCTLYIRNSGLQAIQRHR
jgi:hypothetical protein